MLVLPPEIHHGGATDRICAAYQWMLSATISELEQFAAIVRVNRQDLDIKSANNRGRMSILDLAEMEINRVAENLVTRVLAKKRER